MRTRTSLLIGATILLAGLSASAAASGETVGTPGITKATSGGQQAGGNRWGPRQNGRWYAGWRAPGGWNAYRRPVYGYVLPRYWVQPRYYIANYSAYGLPAPAAGYGWSRYYDDAVMTDRYGRVYDMRSNVDWDRYEGGYADDEADRDRRDNGVGGAAIGAVVGGVAGNRIAGRGNRTAGTLIGAGVGAVTGAIIDKAEDGDRRAPPPRRDGYSYGAGSDYAYADDSVTYGGNYQDQYRGTAHGVTYDAPAYEGRSHWSDQGAPALAAGGYVANGWYYPAPTLTTITVQPATRTTTTTSYVTETVRAARPTVRRKVRR